jgi:hypothetical protein
MRIGGIAPVLLVLGLVLAAAPALAQSETQPGAVSAPEATVDGPADAPADAPPLPDNFSLGDALTSDPPSFAAAPAKHLRLPGYVDGDGLDVNRSDHADGSSTVTLKNPLAAGWETKVGADVAPTPQAIYRPGQPLPVAGSGYDSGAAWATLGVPDLASFDARLDPNIDQSKLGTTLQHAVPIGGKLSLTLQETLSLTDSFAGQTAGLPITPGPVQSWGRENRVKFDILPTGTTLAAGVMTSSIDPVTHNTFSADQKIYGPLHVTTAVNDIGQPTANKSLSAAFKLNW